MTSPCKRGKGRNVRLLTQERSRNVRPRPARQRAESERKAPEMSKVYSEKHNARRAAKRELGSAYLETCLKQVEGGWIIDAGSPDEMQQAKDAAERAANGGLTDQEMHEELTAQQAAYEQEQAKPTLPEATDQDEPLTKLAALHLDITSLQTRGWDAVDFREVSVRRLKAALQAAYDLGRHDAQQEQRPAKAPKAERSAPKAGTPTTVKPIITSPTNQSTARLVDRIEAARGDLRALQGFTFKPSNNYYRQAHDYLRGLIAEAEAMHGEAA
jgi:hypothetical protein